MFLMGSLHIKDRQLLCDTMTEPILSYTFGVLYSVVIIYYMQ